MYSLGFSIGHDRGAVIIKDDKVLVGISDERLTRNKSEGAYSPDIPELSIRYCLDYLNLTFKDINHYVYTMTEHYPNVRERFEALTQLTEYDLKFIPHHLAHAFSTFYSSGFTSSAVVVADGMGSVLTGEDMLEWYPNVNSEFPMVAEAYAIYNFTLDSYTEVYKKWTKYPAEEQRLDEDIAIGLSYGLGSLQLIYDPNSKSWPAGKLMGLASYAPPNNENPYLESEIKNKLTFYDNDLRITGGGIQPQIYWASDFYSKATIAGVYQRIQELACMHLVGMSKRLTQSDNICVAGGSFLNCNTNEEIIKSNLFNGCYFIPGADDSGVALGCAWYGIYKNKKTTPSPKKLSPYIGKVYSDQEIISAIMQRKSEIRFTYYNDFNELVNDVSELLINNKVIGWMQDGSELGPRALGNRSILASPRHGWMREYINAEIKRREWYRPFAPSVLYEKQSEIFDINFHSPYMLVTTQVKDDWKSRIPAVTHIDGTARIQSVSPDDNPKYYSLISKFYQKTNIPVLLNTSFNGPAEAIVESPSDAINTFLKTGLHALVINNFYIYR